MIPAPSLRRVVHYWDQRAKGLLCGRRLNRRYHLTTTELNHVECAECHQRWFRTIRRRAQ